MLKFKTQVLCLFVIVCFHISAQSQRETGYILTLSGDTLRGEVLNANQNSCYSNCTFKTNSDVKKYKPIEIIGYGVDDMFFSSNVIDTSFVEVLMLGTISLYKHEDKYLVKKNGELVVLQASEENVAMGQATYAKVNNKWKGKLSFLISDCLPNAQQLTTSISYNEKDIIKIVRKYNQCSGDVIKEYKENKNWSKFSFGLYSGYTAAKIKFKPEVYNNGDIPESISSTDPGIGIILELSTPRISENFAIQFDPYYSRANYYHSDYLVSGNNQYWIRYMVNLSTLSFPLSIKQTFETRWLDVYYQFGFLFDVQLNSESVKKTQYTDGYEISVFDDDKFIEVESNQMGVFAGIGVAKSFNKLEVGISCRYLGNFYISTYKYVNVFNDRYSINITLMRR